MSEVNAIDQIKQSAQNQSNQAHAERLYGVLRYLAESHADGKPVYIGEYMGCPAYVSVFRTKP